jgi:hypothetical protein
MQFNSILQEIIFQDYGCALSKGVLNHGRMFVCENFICFYANILGIKTKLVLAISEIANIEKQKMLGLIQNAIEIQMKDLKRYFFCSFTVVVAMKHRIVIPFTHFSLRYGRDSLSI